jgi:hypothetical protein
MNCNYSSYNTWKDDLLHIDRWSVCMQITFLKHSRINKFGWLVGFMVLNATCNNISAISWRSVLLVEETRTSEENHRPVASHWHTLSHNVVLSTPGLSEVSAHNNYHTITTTAAPDFMIWYIDYILETFTSKQGNKQWFTSCRNKINYMAFKSFDNESTWCRLFQKHVLITKLDIYTSNTDKQIKPDI